jgi:hypothetical protein
MIIHFSSFYPILCEKNDYLCKTMADEPSWGAPRLPEHTQQLPSSQND